MAADRVAALIACQDANVAYLSKLSEADWAKPSRCPGWTVKDVVSHMGAAYHGAFTVWFVKLMLGKDIEAANDADVAKRRAWPGAQVLAEYTVWGKRFRPMAKALQGPGLRSLPIKVAEVGTYPAAVLAGAFVFDHTLHVRHDIATVLDRPAQAPDANTVAVGIEWMMLGLPAMSGDRLSWLTAPVEVTLVGPGGSTWTVEPGGARGRVVARQGGSGRAVATIEGDAATFGVWGTGREPWRGAGVSVKGDDALGTRFLDAVRII
jgi:uncharacterized protein (TIGR03083 family)